MRTRRCKSARPAPPDDLPVPRLRAQRHGRLFSHLAHTAYPPRCDPLRPHPVVLPDVRAWHGRRRQEGGRTAHPAMIPMPFSVRQARLRNAVTQYSLVVARKPGGCSRPLPAPCAITCRPSPLRSRRGTHEPETPTNHHSALRISAVIRLALSPAAAQDRWHANGQPRVRSRDTPMHASCPVLAATDRRTCVHQTLWQATPALAPILNEKTSPETRVNTRSAAIASPGVS